MFSFDFCLVSSTKVSVVVVDCVCTFFWFVLMLLIVYALFSGLF